MKENDGDCTKRDTLDKQLPKQKKSLQVISVIRFIASAVYFLVRCSMPCLNNASFISMVLNITDENAVWFASWHGFKDPFPFLVEKEHINGIMGPKVHGHHRNRMELSNIPESIGIHVECSSFHFDYNE